MDVRRSTRELYKDTLNTFQGCRDATDDVKLYTLRRKAVNNLKELNDKKDLDLVDTRTTTALIEGAVTCAAFFHFRISLCEGGLFTKRKKIREAEESISAYGNLGVKLVSKYSDVVISTLISTLTEEELWLAESFCEKLFLKLFVSIDITVKLYNGILDYAENIIFGSPEGPVTIVRLLCHTSRVYKWPALNKQLTARLLDAYHASVMPANEAQAKYAPMRRGLQVCLKRIMTNTEDRNMLIIIKIVIQWIVDEDITDGATFDFGNILEYATVLHKTSNYWETMSETLLTFILYLISSENSLHSLLGNVVFQNLLDRHENYGFFKSANICYWQMEYKFHYGEYCIEDEEFLRKYRKQIYSCILSAVKQHGNHLINVECLYASLALLTVEIPCGYTAATVACLAMGIQKIVLFRDSINLESSYRIHAMVVSIFTLVAYIHKADVFYGYLNTVIKERANFAPFLNPPLKIEYHYAQHHVLWNKPELFFEDWAVRYGLWKCFRIKQDPNTIPIIY